MGMFKDRHFSSLSILPNHLDQSRGQWCANVARVLNMIGLPGPRLLSRWPVLFRYLPIILSGLCLYLSYTMDTQTLEEQQHQVQKQLAEIQKKITPLNQHLQREKNAAVLLKNLKAREAFRHYTHPEMAIAIYELATKHSIQIDSKNFRIYPDEMTFSSKEIETKETPIWIFLKEANLENMNDFMDELQKKYLVVIRQDLERFSFRIIWYSVLLQSKN